MEIIMSNGYVFWGAIAAALVASIIYLAKGDFSSKWYTSWWGRFLDQHRFGVWLMVCLVAFAAAFVGSVVYYNKLNEPMPDETFRMLVIGNGVLLAGAVLCLVLCYASACWGKMPLGAMLGWSIAVPFLCGAAFLVNHPSIPSGAISDSLWNALKLNLSAETMAWFKGIGLYRFSTYVEIMRNPACIRWALWFWCGVCAVHIVLCNGWMHCDKIVHRLIYPPVVCLVALLVMPVSLAVGFVLCAWVIFGAVVVVYLIAGLVVLCFVLAAISSWLSSTFGSSGRGQLSDGTKVRQICGSQWEDERGNRWTNTGGNEFVRN